MKFHKSTMLGTELWLSWNILKNIYPVTENDSNDHSEKNIKYRLKGNKKDFHERGEELIQISNSNGDYRLFLSDISSVQIFPFDF